MLIVEFITYYCSTGSLTNWLIIRIPITGFTILLVFSVSGFLYLKVIPHFAIVFNEFPMLSPMYTIIHCIFLLSHHHRKREPGFRWISNPVEERMSFVDFWGWCSVTKVSGWSWYLSTRPTTRMGVFENIIHHVISLALLSLQTLYAKKMNGVACISARRNYVAVENTCRSSQINSAVTYLCIFLREREEKVKKDSHFLPTKTDSEWFIQIENVSSFSKWLLQYTSTFRIIGTDSRKPEKHVTFFHWSIVRIYPPRVGCVVDIKIAATAAWRPTRFWQLEIPFENTEQRQVKCGETKKN